MRYYPNHKLNLLMSAYISEVGIFIIRAEIEDRRGKRERFYTLVSTSAERALSLVRYDDLTTKQRAFARYRRMLKAIKNVKFTTHERI